MKWSEKPYKLEDGSEVRGELAAAMRSLDTYDPTSPERTDKRTTESAREELENYLGNVRWCPDLNKWVVPASIDMYALVDDAAIRAKVESFFSARLLWALEEQGKYPDEKRVKAFANEARKQDTAKTVNDMTASLMRRHRVMASELDTQPVFLGTPSGVVSLDDFELLSERDDWLAMAGVQPQGRYSALSFNVTKRVRGELPSTYHRREFAYDPRWDRFIDEICDGDADKAAFLQRALGYSLYGGNPEKATFVLWGAKRDNGKSTLMNVVKHVMGDYAGSMKPGEILVNRHENPQAANPGIAKLVGKRLVDVSEPPLGAELNSALIKQMASGVDEISARHLKCDEFSFVPQFTLWMHCNALPIVRDPTAIDPKHMFVIEFTRSFTGAERDLTLTDRFKTPDGMYTVLTWLLKGYSDYRERGLDAPGNVIAATTNWLTVSKSWLQAFLEQCCIIESSQRCDKTELKEAARAFCEAQGETFSLKGFKAALKAANIAEGKSGPIRFYKGVGLLPSGDKKESGNVPQPVQLGQNNSEGEARVVLT